MVVAVRARVQASKWAATTRIACRGTHENRVIGLDLELDALLQGMLADWPTPDSGSAPPW